MKATIELGIDERHGTNPAHLVLLAVVCLLASAGPIHGTTFDEISKLTASDAAQNDKLGWAVSVSGNIAVVGAPNDGAEVGAAYVFDVNTGNELFKLTASDWANFDEFGYSVAVTGNRAVIGARYDDDHGMQSGSAYVFDVTTGNELFKLTASDAVANATFGYSVAISGNTAVIGARSDDDSGSATGSAYVFDIDTGSELFKLTASDGDALDHFGHSVAASGNLAVIGAKYDEDRGDQSGSAYIFDLTTGNELFKLLGSDVGSNGHFGQSVGISGNRAVVTARNANLGDGAAYVFDVTTGNELFKLTASDAVPHVSFAFGWSGAVSGNLAVIGAYSDDDNGQSSGSAYVFDVATGNEMCKLTASDGAWGDEFGISVAIDDNTIVVGAHQDNDNAIDAGSAYVFSSDPIPPPPRGDINGDGVVNVADLGILAGFWGMSGTIADIDGDGVVGVADLGMMAHDWTGGGGSSRSSTTAVPAPSAGLACLVLIGAMGSVKRR